MNTLTEVESWLKDAPSVHELKYELEKLRNIRAWAIERIGIDYRVGDSVVIKRAPKLSEAATPGWMQYSECLVAGARATVREIDFYGGRWRTGFLLERQWSVTEWGTGDWHRYWNGPEETMPDDPTYKRAHRGPGLFTLDALSLAKA